MINLIHAEFFKLRKSMWTKAAILISCIAAIGLSVVSHMVAMGDLSAEISSSASGLSEVLIMSLWGSLMIGVIICTDFETKTVHNEIAASGRSKVVIGKSIVCVLMSLVLMLPYIIVTLVSVCINMKFAEPFMASEFINMIAQYSGSEITSSVIGRIIVISLAEAIVYAGRLSVCIPIAFKVRKPLAVMGIGFVASGIIDLFAGILSDVDIINDMLSFTPYFRNYLLIPTDESTGALIKTVAVSLIFIVVMALVTVKLFKKSEIK